MTAWHILKLNRVRSTWIWYSTAAFSCQLFLVFWYFFKSYLYIHVPLTVREEQSFIPLVRLTENFCALEGCHHNSFNIDLNKSVTTTQYAFIFQRNMSCLPHAEREMLISQANTYRLEYLCVNVSA